MLKINMELNKKFIDFYKEVFRDAKLSLKTKELIALAVSLGTGCRPCYALHLEKARELGNSDEEIREAIGVAEVVTAGKVREIVYGEHSKAAKSGK